MNNLLSVLGLACVNASFRERLFEEGGAIEARIHALLTANEKRFLSKLFDSREKIATLREALEIVRLAAEVDCPTPPYCPWPDKDFADGGESGAGGYGRPTRPKA